MTRNPLGRRWLTRGDVSEHWRQVAKRVGGDFHRVRSPHGPAVQLRTKHGIITLLRRKTGDIGSICEIRAPFRNPRDVHFRITPTGSYGFSRRIRGLLRARTDLQIGDQELDDMFHVDTGSAIQVQGMMRDPPIRRLLVRLPKLRLSVRDRPPTATLPWGVDELYWPLPRAPRDEGLTLRMFELFTELLRYFEEEGDDYEDQVRLNIKRLQAVGGIVRSPALNLVLWDGDDSRWKAAEELGRLGDARALRALNAALTDDTSVVRMKAIRALGKIGDRASVKELIPLLGQLDEDIQGDVGDVAAEALADLGAGELVEAYEQALSGDTGRLRAMAGDHREEVIVALLGSLRDPGRRVFGEAFRALADLGAVWTLPVLRQKVKEVKIRGLAEMCEEAISDLESLQSLPRPVISPLEGSETLPRVAKPARERPATLPRQVPGGGEEAGE